VTVGPFDGRSEFTVDRPDRTEESKRNKIVNMEMGQATAALARSMLSIRAGFSLGRPHLDWLSTSTLKYIHNRQ